jgi:DNA anti-recombination protein RmuC
MENMTETQEMESDKIWEALNDLINKFDKSFENLKHVQEEFKNDYGF